MTLLRGAGLQLAFGERVVFDDLTLTIEEGERVGLVGVNGSGKSSLLRILAGVAAADRGEVQQRRGMTVTYLPQEPLFPAGATVASELTLAGSLREALDEHTRLSKRLGDAPTDDQAKMLERLAELADSIESGGGWDTEHHARILLDRLGVREWERSISELSGGLKKRVAIARALLTNADALLLDEPTNHLDADTVEWLEEELDARKGALVLVTHDRYFLDDLVDRIVEIDPSAPGGVTSWIGNYQSYLEQKLDAQSKAAVAEHKRERWIAQEVAWLRKGVEARRTKSKARIDRARKLLSEKGWKPPEVAALQSAGAPRLGHTVLEAEEIEKRFGEIVVAKGASVIVQKGERIGLVGPNGVGKTTFLKLLLGFDAPDEGTVVMGKNTKIAYYDQAREQLDPSKTVYESAANEDWLDIGGGRVHLRDYLEDLLFPVAMQKLQVRQLSGGERNRLLLARLFLQRANVLMLDEPTNDLDIVTLNVLERMLLGFDGAVLFVTHDRYFLNKVATSILAFEGGGKVVRYPGNFDDYRRLSAKNREHAPAAVSETKAGRVETAAARRPRKLSNKEQRELDGIETAIQTAEARKAALDAELADPASWAGASAKAPALQSELLAVVAEIERLYARWEELSAL